MKGNKYEHRRARFGELLKVCGTQARLAERIEKAPSYISRLLSTSTSKGHKNIGDDIVEACSAAFKLPPGWFEMSLGTALPGDAADAAANLEQASAPLSPRGLSLALRLDALSAERRDRAYALMDLTLTTVEAEEIAAQQASPSAKRRSRDA